MLTMAMLHDAQRVLSGVINKTPVIPSTGITDECRLFLKALSPYTHLTLPTTELV